MFASTIAQLAAMRVLSKILVGGGPPGPVEVQTDMYQIYFGGEDGIDKHYLTVDPETHIIDLKVGIQNASNFHIEGNEGQSDEYEVVTKCKYGHRKITHLIRVNVNNTHENQFSVARRKPDGTLRLLDIWDERAIDLQWSRKFESLNKNGVHPRKVFHIQRVTPNTIPVSTWGIDPTDPRIRLGWIANTPTKLALASLLPPDYGNSLPPSDSHVHANIEISVIKGEIMKNIRNTTRDREMFVLPSQLNGAEYPDKGIIVKHDAVPRDYLNDNTGGPRGQLACDNLVAKTVAAYAANDQRTDGINYVDDILDHMNSSIRMMNGYLVIKRNHVNWENDAKKFRDQLHKCKILASFDNQVRGYTETKKSVKCVIVDDHQIKTVDLVYASAVPVGTYGNDNSNFTKAIARMVLFAQYRNAAELAVHRSKELCCTKDAPYTVYFMPLGGGVFNNNPNDIANAIVSAVDAVHSHDNIQFRILTWEGSSDNEFDQYTRLMSNRRSVEWSCPACTYNNPESATVCEICGAART